MRCLCKRDFLFIIKDKNRLIFEKDKWYEEDISLPHMVGRKNYTFITNKVDYSFMIYEEELKEHFYTQQESREIEIDKVLDI